MKNFENKADEINFEGQVAKNADLGHLKFQKRDGMFQAEYTYGQDPIPRRAKGKFDSSKAKIHKI